jgi:hypothetical protein
MGFHSKTRRMNKSKTTKNPTWLWQPMENRRRHTKGRTLISQRPHAIVVARKVTMHLSATKNSKLPRTCSSLGSQMANLMTASTSCSVSAATLFQNEQKMSNKPQDKVENRTQSPAKLPDVLFKTEGQFVRAKKDKSAPLARQKSC